jgi:hypothetical protein
MRFKKEGVYVTSLSNEHTFIDLFFEDTCMQVIQLWYTMILFRLWVIHDDDDDVLRLIVILMYMYWLILLMSFPECA